MTITKFQMLCNEIGSAGLSGYAVPSRKVTLLLLMRMEEFILQMRFHLPLFKTKNTSSKHKNLFAN